MFQNIEDTLDYIYSFTNLEKTGTSTSCYSLDNIKNILECLGNPHSRLKFIHIAGTKGKGSTSLFITRLLLECGYNTLTFTSPHLIRTNERITYNMMEISDEDLIDITNSLKSIFEKNNLIPTTFEFFFVIAILYGIQKDVDYFVIETGLGGRLDCTNIITTQISVITTIGFDHTEILGNTIKQIAKEKAGIIKSKSPVILGKQIYRCSNVFSNIAKKQSSPFFSVKKVYKVRNIRYKDEGISFSFKRKGKDEVDFLLPFYGKHQIWNFLTALETVLQISPNLIEHLKIYDSIDLSIPGRIELLSSSDNVFIDTAHNKESIDSLVAALKKHFPNKKWNVLLSVCTTKDVSYISKKISKIAERVLVTNLSSYKNANVQQLTEELRKHCGNVELIPEQEKAFEVFMTDKKYSDVKLVTGSFYLSGPFKEWYLQR
jgi:dihydrofolate synthase/folylpolyglutamate synthase